MMYEFADDPQEYLRDCHQRSISETAYSMDKRRFPWKLRKRLAWRKDVESFLRRGRPQHPAVLLPVISGALPHQRDEVLNYVPKPSVCLCLYSIDENVDCLATASGQNTKYCQTCGAPNDAGVTYCQKCGGMSFAPVAPSRISRPLGVTIIGGLQIVWSILILIFGLSFAALLGPLGLIFLPFTIIPLIFALALFAGRNWARILMLIGGVLDIITVVGIIWGIIILWYFTRPRTVAYFKQPK